MYFWTYNYSHNFCSNFSDRVCVGEEVDFFDFYDMNANSNFLFDLFLQRTSDEGNLNVFFSNLTM